MSKGDRPREVDKAKYDKEFERIFGSPAKGKLKAIDDSPAHRGSHLTNLEVPEDKEEDALMAENKKEEATT